ncbi:uncharacterized protein FIESC28_00248 [Fusarium coffeatum]|uniref:Uncharacterized protein n=1 Tax=Fusarium coffeatum TaxID=231269 RepID=A0A366SE30_9HYPO|nr:uncharacterized protein FIESC28_00248 [Fusarium coffeatum]RBR26980.1 hypothetical protein FIESC28_00248 [Fusarium coffeatum]
MVSFADLEPPLYKAIREGNTTLFTQLIAQPEHRANLYRDGHVCSGFNLMSTAIPGGQIEIARILFVLDAFDFSKYSSYLFRWACDKPAIFRLIVETGRADITAHGEAGMTPLYHASNAGCLEIVDFLLKEGVDAEVKDNNGRTPLAYAAMKGSQEVTRRLLGIGAVNPDSKDNEGKTPFYWAIFSTQGAVARILNDTGRVDTSVEGRAMRDRQARPKFTVMVLQNEDNSISPQPRGHKRQSSKTDSSAPEPKPKQSKKTEESHAQAEPSTPTEETKPTLTDKALEFDFDHSKIRDPRRTSGRVRRPHYEKRELSEEWLSKFHIPNHRDEKNDPLYCFYELYQCHKKGPNGSPTYDSAGFQLDYKKVEKWMKPKGDEEKKAAYEVFFVDGKGPDCGHHLVMDLIKDKMSKDLDIPLHQIDVKQIKKWGEKGFEKVKADEWWVEPNEVEKAHFSKMMGGAKLRKDL